MRKKRKNILTMPKNKPKPISDKLAIVKSVPKQNLIRDVLITQSPVSFVMDRAQELQASLSRKYPSFLKPVHKSHVGGRFCMYLPKDFCDSNLPNYDESVVLVDENNQEYPTRYVLLRNKLDGGWRAFSNAQKLMEGDAMVFHLFGYCKFKVYIIRAADDKAIELVDSDFQAKPIDTDQLSNDMDNKFDLKGRFSKSKVDFEDMKCFEDFEICVHGLRLDSEIPVRYRRYYYTLCCSQEMFLHKNLIGDLNRKLIAGMISETSKIAESITSANISTSVQSLKLRDNTLEAIEILGMSVNFLRDRLNKLIILACKYKVIMDSISKKKARLDDDSRAQKKGALKTDLLMDGIEIESLEMKKEKLGFKFKELANAPW